MQYLETHQKSKNSIFVKNLLIVTACCLITWYLCMHIKVTLTNSLIKRVFWAVKDDRKSALIKSGQYIIFDQVVPEPAVHVVKFIKRVGCSSGEILRFESDSYYCNGKYIGHAKRQSLTGGALTPFVFNGEVPVDMIFAIGDHPDSFDSRYVGFISRVRVEEVAWALF